MSWFESIWVWEPRLFLFFVIRDVVVLLPWEVCRVESTCGVDQLASTSVPVEFVFEYKRSKPIPVVVKEFDWDPMVFL